MKRAINVVLNVLAVAVLAAVVLVLLSVDTYARVEGQAEVYIAQIQDRFGPENSPESDQYDHTHGVYAGVYVGGPDIGIRGSAWLSNEISSVITGEVGVLFGADRRVEGYIGMGLLATDIRTGERELLEVYRAGAYLRVARVGQTDLMLGAGMRYLDLDNQADLQPWASISWRGQ